MLGIGLKRDCCAGCKGCTGGATGGDSGGSRPILRKSLSVGRSSGRTLFAAKSLPYHGRNCMLFPGQID